MKKSDTNIVHISTHKDKNYYFAVGVSKTGKIVSIALPKSSHDEAVAEITKFHPEFRLSNEHSKIAMQISQIYRGKDIEFNIDTLEIGESQNEPNKTPFEWEVLLEVSKIAHGSVKTYKEIAKSINSHAYRAVGTAIGKNPFPLVIPCHRVIRSDYQIGGYRGGTEMKRNILKNEGIKIKGFKVVSE
jgi:methylated-DNA-[protein]-cysteine S-methyltransferase